MVLQDLLFETVMMEIYYSINLLISSIPVDGKKIRIIE